MSSTGVATGAEAVTSSHIEEVTEELTQPRVLKFLLLTRYLRIQPP